MVRDGIPWVVVPLVLALVSHLPVYWGYWAFWPLALFFLAIAAFMAFFFRNPHRTIPDDSGIVVAPADGRVTLVQTASDRFGESLISIFLSPFDVHINRAPIAGRITEISYKSGKFLMATDKRARLLNEQNTLTIEGDGLTVRCVQIAGILARRIVCWKKEGEQVECGERFGMIKFSSRTDILMPARVQITVREGMHVRGGVTIIGRFSK